MSDTSTTLQDAINGLQGVRIAALIEQDPHRASHYRCSGAGIHLDYSKHRLDDAAREALLTLAQQQALNAAFDGLVTGKKVNNTEGRPALHTLLRGTASDASPEYWQEVDHTLQRLRDTVERVHTGQLRGHGGESITDVVNIGIGGSDLGPRMVCEALASRDDPLRSHFVANVDPWALDRILAGLNPHRTLFVVCSKSFGTEETLTNALRARRWLTDHGVPDDAIHHHVLAVTTNIAAAAEFGISESQCFPIWDWVGGRYSLWSAIGLVIALQCGWPAFEALLAGAQAMDEHTRHTAPADNLPMMMALLEYWHCQLQHCDSHLVLPYSQRLSQLADFLQQLTMESNGKRVQADGSALQIPSAPMLWGSAGTIGQHSYYQLLHQGTRPFTADIILPLTNGDVDLDAHRKLAANALAQSRALLLGRSENEAEALIAARGMDASLAPHLVLPGNHSHSMIWFDTVDAKHLGALLAAYEHKTFFLAQLLEINAFDQWGVELGKEIGRQIRGSLETGEGLDQLDPATAAIAAAWREANAS
jgi:glucose-6-phosphate isomerase